MHVETSPLKPSRRGFLIAAASTLAARAQDREATFSTDVKVVSLLANVRSRQGEIVRNLEKQDFQIAENGRPQTIRYFSRETDLPLTLGLLVDTSMSQYHVIDLERAASFRFLDRVLRENKDQVFVMQFDMTVRTPQGLTNSHQALEHALTFVDTPTRAELRGQYGGGTLLFDAVVEASRKIMAGQNGRKAVIVMSDGGENGSDASMTAAIEAAQRSDTLVYSILFGGAEGRGILQRMSKETGGGFFEVTKKLSIDQIFDIVQDELRSQYNLGFVSDVPVRVSEFRKLQLTTTRKGLVVQSRDRYWAKR